MILKVLLVACVAAAHGGGLLAPYAYGAPYGGGYYGGNPYSSYPAQPALASHSSNTYRSPFNLGQVSTYSKAIDTPFSSVRKSDIRVSNPGVSLGYGGYGAYGGYAAPVVSHGGYGGYAAPLVSHGAYGGYAAPVVSHVSPYAAPIAKVATAGGLLGVAYSAAPAVSHMTYTNGLGLAYAW